MRVSTANRFDSSIANLQRRQQEMQTSQQQLTSGKRVSVASDDPTGAARSQRAQSAIGRIEANQRALEASRNSMTLSEGALGDANELLQQVRETMVQAGNASFSDAERKSLAEKISGLRAQILSISNRGDGAGGFLFSGQGAANPPFLDQPGGVTYSGVAGIIQTGNVENFALTVDGRAAFEQARTGNGTFVTSAGTNLTTGAAPGGWIAPGQVTDPAAITGQPYVIAITGTAPAQTYTITNSTSGATATGPFETGKSIGFEGLAVSIAGAPVAGDRFEIKASTNDLKLFDVLDQAITELKTPLRNGAQIAQSTSGRIRDLDAVMVNLQNVRSLVGETMNNLDGTETRMAAVKQYNAAEQSAAEDLDMVSGISEFQNQQTGYDAALKTYAMVQRMSLFQYLSS